MRPNDPDWRATTERTWAAQPMAAFLGMALDDLGPGWVQARLALRPEFRQQDAVAHGGLLATLADQAAAFAALTLAAPGERILTVEFSIHFLRPADAPTLLCRGQVLKPGRTLTVSEAEITAEGDDRLLAKATATVALVG